MRRGSLIRDHSSSLINPRRAIHEALNRLGRELFPSAWTGEEHKAPAKQSHSDGADIRVYRSFNGPKILMLAPPAF